MSSTTGVLIIGISGVTCGGKTTLAARLHQLLPNSRLVSQDDYFFPVDDVRHVWLPELDHINFDIVTSLDMERLRDDVIAFAKAASTTAPRVHPKTRPEPPESLEELVGFVNRKMSILIVEGFCLFNYRPIVELFDLKYYFVLDQDECRRRRLTRVYEPPDCPGYFERCAWPEHVRQKEEVQLNVTGVKYLDGTGSGEEFLLWVLRDAADHIKKTTHCSTE